MNHSNRLRLSKLSIGLIVALAAAPAFAQSTSAGVGGQVVGSDRQPLSGAEVTIVHSESGTSSRVVTDANGRYNARGLRVGGPYTITVNKEGSGTDTENDVYLNLNEVSQVDLSIGADELETIKVTGTGFSQVFASDKMGSGSNVTRQQIEAYSSINRNLQDYVRFDPRIAQTDKSRNEISVGGQNPRYNSIRVDGISTNDAFGLESNGLPTPKQPFSMDTIDEIAVDVANYDVTISGGTGGVINAVTKSGTNEFHGSVYGIYRDNDWSGKNQNDVRPVLFDNETTYGFTLGGPIVKDRLFFFANYEKYKGKELFVGTGASSGPIGSGASNIVNITQAQIDEVIRLANVRNFDPGTLALPALNTESEEVGVKIDWNINDSHRASFRYGKSEQSQANLNGFGATSLALSSHQYVRDFELETYTGSLFSDWTENFSTEAKVSFRDYSAVRTPLANLPAISVRIGSATLNLGTEENTHANILKTETWNAFFAGNLFLGDHALKFGFDYEDNDIYNLFGRRTNGVYQFNCIRTATTPQFGAGCAQSFESGVSSRYQLFYPQGGNLDNMAAIWGIKNLGLFIQDSWAINDKLTLTLGLRYDEPTVKNDPRFNATASAAFGYDNSATIDGNGLFQPRFGFNYRFDTERSTQLRGGVGLFQGASASVWLSNPYSNNGLSYIDYFDSTGTTLFSPDPRNQLPVALNGGVPGTQSIDFIDPDLGQPSVWKANLAFDKELPWWGMVAGVEAVMTQVEEGIYYQQLNLGRATAVGQDGRMIYWNAAGRNPASWNQQGVGTGTSARTNRLIAYNDAIIARSTNKGGSEQLTVSLEKPFSKTSDWSWQLAYTYTNAREVSPLTSSTSSSQLGNVAIFQANEEVTARSNYEIRDRFTAALNWKHDFFGDNTTSVGLFYEGRTGRAYSYTFDNDANGDGRINDLLYIPTAPGDVRFNNATEESAFWQYVYGNEYLNSHRGQLADRNGARGSWVNQFDLRISQEFPGFMQGHKAEVSLDIANIGNLLNKDWGVIEEVGFPGMRGIVEYGGIDPGTGKYVYRFNTPDATNIYDDRGISRWSAQVSLRYKF